MTDVDRVGWAAQETLEVKFRPWLGVEPVQSRPLCCSVYGVPLSDTVVDTL